MVGSAGCHKATKRMMTWLVYKSGSLLTDEMLVVMERCEVWVDLINLFLLIG